MSSSGSRATRSKPRSLRVDAERNRGRIVQAAEAAFARHGLEVPLEDVAAQAGVGIATLYRRFPTRDDLIAACFERRLEEYALTAQTALEFKDPWEGFCFHVMTICSMQAADRGLRDVLTREFPEAKALEKHRAEGYALTVQLIVRAQAAGSLRSDFVPEDLILLLMANGGVVQAMSDIFPDAWQRLIGILLDGLHVGEAGALPAPPSPRQMVRAMRRMAQG